MLTDPGKSVVRSTEAGGENALGKALAAVANVAAVSFLREQ